MVLAHFFLDSVPEKEVKATTIITSKIVLPGKLGLSAFLLQSFDVDFVLFHVLFGSRIRWSNVSVLFHMLIYGLSSIRVVIAGESTLAIASKVAIHSKQAKHSYKYTLHRIVPSSGFDAHSPLSDHLS